MKIKISKSGVNRIGTKLISNADDLRNEKHRINLLLDELADAWTGDDGKACINNMREVYIPNFEKVCTKIEKYGEYLKKVQCAYDEVDMVFKSKRIVKK